MRGFLSLIVFSALVSAADANGESHLAFKDFMHSIMQDDIRFQSNESRELIWDEAHLDQRLGWDQNLNLKWRRMDLDAGPQVRAEGHVVQETPYGFSVEAQYLHPDPVTALKTASFGVQWDVWRNRFGRETDRQRELLQLRKSILSSETAESGFQACLQGLTSVSRYLLIERQEAIYHSMLQLRQRLHALIRKRVAQSALSRTDLASVDLEIASLNREIKSLKQAKAEWLAIEQTRLARDFAGLRLPQDKNFVRFDFIRQQESAWLPEIDILARRQEESEAQVRLLEEQESASLKTFGQKLEDVEGKGDSRHEFGFVLTIPIHNFASKREIYQQKTTAQGLATERRIAEQKALMLLAETQAKVLLINQRLKDGEQNLKAHTGLDDLLWEQYQKGAVALERLFRQQELRLRAELDQEQTLYELRSARSLSILMQKERPNFCSGS